MAQFALDVRFGLRLLARSPGFSAVAILALALGIGATTAIFSVVYSTLLGPLPYHEAERLVMVWSRIQADGGRNSTATADFLDWKRQATVFEDLNAWSGSTVNLAADGRPEQVEAFMPTPGFYTMIGMKFLLGRDFRPEEGQPGREQVVILRYRLWQDRFGSDPSIIGRAIRINGKPYTVVGVLAPGPVDRAPVSLALPLAFAPEQINHDFHWLLVMGRLKPGVTVTQADANVKAIASQIAQAYPKSNTGWSASVEPFRNNFLPRETIAALWLLLGAVVFVLLIACANVANLLLARGTIRQRELAVRASLGASRGRLLRQLLTESLILAAIGGVLGIAIAAALMRVMLALLPVNALPWETNAELSLPVLGFTLLVSVISGMLFGCIPAWQATRGSMNDVLKEAGRSAVSGGRHRLRRALIVAEFALALTLLAGGGLAIQSFITVMSVDLGFRSDHLLTFSLQPPAERLDGAERIVTFYQGLLDRLQATPGVASATVSTGMPVRGTSFGMPFHFVGREPSDPSKRDGAGFNMVTPDYHRTFGIGMVRGRAFTDRDRAGSPPVAIVNEVFVQRYLGGLDPLQQRIVVEQIVPGLRKLGPPIAWEIVGISRAIRNAGPSGRDFPQIDVPFAQSPWPTVRVTVRTLGDPASLQPQLAAAVGAIDPDLPLAQVMTMEQVLSERVAWARFKTVLFGGFAAAALLLAAFGIYGVMSFVVAQRTHEIGLRMALGAGAGQVVGQVLREGMGTAAIGVVLGFGGAYVVGRAMQGMWFGVGAIEPVAFSVVSVVLLGAALLACVIPARRAARVDPLVALRQD